MPSQDLATVLLNNNRSLWDKVTGTYYTRAANGAIYRGHKESGHITMDRYADSVSRDTFERKVNGVDYNGKIRD